MAVRVTPQVSPAQHLANDVVPGFELAAAACELRKFGATVDEREDGLRIEPPNAGLKLGVSIDTYDDHRMAMAFSMVGDVAIRGPGCVAKTFPDYFAELGRFGMVAAASDRDRA